MKYYYLFIFLVLFFYDSQLQAQVTATTDSLIQLIETSPDPEEKANLYIQLAEIKSSAAPGEALQYLRSGLELDLNDSKTGEIHDRLGRIFYATGDFEEALTSFTLASEFKKNSGELGEAASANNRVGVVLVRQNKLEQALGVLTESASFFEKIGDEINLATVHNNMAGIFASIDDIENAIHYNELALPVFRRHGISQNEIITLTNLAGQYIELNNFDKAIHFNYLAEQIATKLNNQYALGIVHNNFGQIYFEQNDIQRSIDSYEKSLESKLQSGNYSNLVPTYNNLGQAYLTINQPRQAIQYLARGLAKASGKERWHITSNLAKAYAKAFIPDSATYYFDETLKIRDSLLTADREETISRLNTEYETERRELEIKQLTLLQEQNRVRFIWLLALFGTAIISGFFILKNSRKKQIIAQQNEQIEKQNVEQLLQEQELIGINAMLEGQEKERGKIAAELHDTIGNSLATLKLYIESLDDAKEQEKYRQLHQKTSHLLEETYDEVRKIAHNKSAGVLIKKGLAPAVESMANRISEARKVNIQVIGTGLKDRLENSVEISIFRTIQELLSNAIKYSSASEVVVQIIQHDSTLNIIVEDDGVGFDPEGAQWGLGYTNIQNRMEDLDGELNIDSSPGNGTTVILNVPVE